MKCLTLFVQLFLFTAITTAPVWADNCNPFASDTCSNAASSVVHLEGTYDVNGVSFTPLSSFPRGGAVGTIQGTWTGMGGLFGSPSFGYSNVGTIGSAPFSVTANGHGLGAGTTLYSEMLNPETGQVVFMTPNSEGGFLKCRTTVAPEPASLTLLGTGLLGLVGLRRRKKS